MATPLRVFGVDLSYTDTGLGDCRDGIVTRSSVCTDLGDYPWTWTGKGKKKTRHPTRASVRLRIDDLLGGIFIAIGTAPRPALITLEGPSYGSKGSALHELGGAWWIVFRELEHAGHTVAVIAPSTLKLYATGNGAATKPDMRVALLNRTGVDERNDNRVDAHWLAAAGSDYLGQPIIGVPKRQREALAKADWPIAAPAVAA